jgi:hypothetical protein
MSNNLTNLEENLRTLEKEVLKGDLNSFDQWITYLNTTYAEYLRRTGNTVNNLIATWVSRSNARGGMSLLQIAVVSGNPDMVKRVLSVCVNPEIATNFDLEYRKQSSADPNPEIDQFNGKTARGIVDNILRTTRLPPEYKANYEEIKEILLKIGAEGKHPTFRGVMKAIGWTVGTATTGIVTLWSEGFVGGRKKTLRKKRKNRRKTRVAY